MSTLITYSSLHRLVDEECSIKEKISFEDFKSQNGFHQGIRLKGDPKDLGLKISHWFKTNAIGRSEYLSLANKVMDYFLGLRTLLLNTSNPTLEII